MTVDSLHLKQFSVFEDAELAFSPGINVFLGTNGTGKSHAMKALYAPLKAIEESAPEGVDPHAFTMNEAPPGVQAGSRRPRPPRPSRRRR
jgi:predicted ATPase